MNIAKNIIDGFLDVPYFDITEEYANLLEEWYGDDLSMIDYDDEDLANTVKGLSRSIYFWRLSPKRKTSCERLRFFSYEALIEQHRTLLEDYLALRYNWYQLIRDSKRGMRPRKLRAHIHCGNATKERRVSVKSKPAA